MKARSPLKKYRSAKKPDSQHKGAKNDAAAPPQPAPAPAQPAPSGAIEKTMHQIVRASPDTKQNGGFRPIENTRDI